MIRAIIIDDEAQVVKDLVGLIRLYCDDVELVGKAYSFSEGIQLIQEAQPDLVFLDIRLDEGTGMDLLRQLGSWDFRVIFVTAFDQYAIEAFKFNAIDYLLKPVDPDELINAIERTRHALVNHDFKHQLMHLMDNFQHPEKDFEKIILKDVENLYVVRIQDIVWCEASGSYTKFHVQDGQEILVSKHLKAYEKLLNKQSFYRIHRSYLVNINHIVRYNKTEGELILTGDYSIPVSIRSEELNTILARL